MAKSNSANQSPLSPGSTENEFASLLKRFNTNNSREAVFSNYVVRCLTINLSTLVSELTLKEQSKTLSKALIEFGKIVETYKDCFYTQGIEGLPWSALSGTALQESANTIVQNADSAALSAIPAINVAPSYILPNSELNLLAYLMALTDFKLELLSGNHRGFSVIGSPAIQEYIARILFNFIDSDDPIAKSFFASKRIEGYIERLSFVKTTVVNLVSQKYSTEEQIQIVSFGAANFLAVISAISSMMIPRNVVINYVIYETDVQAVKACTDIAKLYGFTKRPSGTSFVSKKGKVAITIEPLENDKFIALPQMLKEADTALDIVEFAGLQEFLPDAINERLLRRLFECMVNGSQLIGSGLLMGFEDLYASYIHAPYHALFPRTLEQVANQVQKLPDLLAENIQLSSAKNNSYYFYVIEK